MELYSQSQADDILGVYYTRNKDSKVQIFKQGNMYFGKVLWLKTSVDERGKPLLDQKNSDLSLRVKPLVGLVFMTNFIYKDGVWLEG